MLRLTFRRPGVYCFEAHTTPNSAASRRLHLWAVRRVQRVVVISEALRRWYLDHGIAPERLLLARDAADPAVFEGITRDQARAVLGIDADAPMVCYLGHLYPWKGVDTLLQAVPELDPDVRVFVVGGVSPDLDRIRDAAHGLPNVYLTGHLAPAEARRYLTACDVAIIPFSATSAIARDHTSPLKLFEYMAAGCAIVASDLPSLREVLTDGRNAVLVKPDDPRALAAGISRVLRDHELAARIRRAARAEVEAHTWTRRAASILDFLGSPPEA
jgi:glycosyltransferase involved in cell wall biosynthesis